MQPLEGITVIALEQAVAAPLATRHLADLGARVIKIERPGAGDFARGYDTTVRGMSSHFVWLNRSKESLTLDVKAAEAKDVFTRLLSRADVFVQNLAPSAVQRLALGAGELRQKYPKLIVCNLSGYGASGPYRDKKAYDLLIQSEAGLLSITGTEDEPSKAGILHEIWRQGAGADRRRSRRDRSLRALSKRGSKAGFLEHSEQARMGKILPSGSPAR